jgi:NAD(P)-dependent dehydrogenase (short-subunit alcohol dehydrogenase family)
MDNQPPRPDPQVLVTGASQGIGRAILQTLLQSGTSATGLSRSCPESIAGGPGSNATFAWIRLDLSDLADVERQAFSMRSRGIRALVLSAVDYGSDRRHPTSETTQQEWWQVITTNCTGQCLLVSRLLPCLLSAAPGIIVNISSDVALLPAPGRTAYAASKAGLHAMLRGAAEEYSPDCLRVYQLIPKFQLDTEGIRRRRPPGFDFSSYADPALIGRIAQEILATSGAGIPPGTYSVCRDGTMVPYEEIINI